jgi:hypothetical protein
MAKDYWERWRTCQHVAEDTRVSPLPDGGSRTVEECRCGSIRSTLVEMVRLSKTSSPVMVIRQTEWT